MTELASGLRNFKNYRAEQERVTPPTIPYLAVHLKDLTFIEDGNASFKSDDMVNFEKMTMLTDVFLKIQQYQKQKYEFEPISSIQDYLKNLNIVRDDKELYQLSQLCEEGNRGTTGGLKFSLRRSQQPELPRLSQSQPTKQKEQKEQNKEQQKNQNKEQQKEQNKEQKEQQKEQPKERQQKEQNKEQQPQIAVPNSSLTASQQLSDQNTTSQPIAAHHRSITPISSQFLEELKSGILGRQKLEDSSANNNNNNSTLNKSRISETKSIREGRIVFIPQARSNFLAKQDANNTTTQLGSTKNDEAHASTIATKAIGEKAQSRNQFSKNASRLVRRKSQAIRKGVKIVFVGDSVGKSTFLHCYMQKEPPQSDRYDPTIVESFSSDVMFEGQNVPVTLIDTASSEDLSRIRTMHYPDADVIVFCYCVVDRGSFENVKAKWVLEICNRAANSRAAWFLLGLQTDRIPAAPKTQNVVTEEEALALAKQIGCLQSVQLSAYDVKNQYDKIASFMTTVVSRTLKTELKDTIKWRKDGLMLL